MKKNLYKRGPFSVAKLTGNFGTKYQLVAETSEEKPVLFFEPVHLTSGTVQINQWGKVTGHGTIRFVPSEDYINLLCAEDWNRGVVIKASIIAFEKGLTMDLYRFSSKLEGINPCHNHFVGNGIIAFETDVPLKEMDLISLNGHMLKVSSLLPVAWSDTLEVTEEKCGNIFSGNSVYVFKGEGKVLLRQL